MVASLLALPDRWLNRVTMYQLVIGYLTVLLGVAVVASWRGLLAYPPVAVLGTAAIAVTACVAINSLFAAAFGAPVNHDSAVITGLILWHRRCVGLTPNHVRNVGRKAISASRPPVASPVASPALPYVVRIHLATIRGQAQLATRHARQLPDPERLLLLARLQAIDAAALALVAQLTPWEGTVRRGD